MRLLLALIFATINLSQSLAITPEIWSIDKDHSKMGFTITHLSITDLDGSFKITEATITKSKSDFADAVVYLKADANSINTENDMRDENLRKQDFFDTKKYPDIIFRSTSFIRIDSLNYKVVGDLTMHGITKAVTLNAILRIGKHPMNNNPIAGFRVSGIVKRKDFGISENTPSAMLSDEVILRANVEFYKD